MDLYTDNFSDSSLIDLDYDISQFSGLSLSISCSQTTQQENVYEILREHELGNLMDAAKNEESTCPPQASADDSHNNSIGNTSPFSTLNDSDIENINLTVTRQRKDRKQLSLGRKVLSLKPSTSGSCSSSAPVKRSAIDHRGENFTTQHSTWVLQEVDKKHDKLFGSFVGKGGGRALKKEEWEDIATRFNE
jgi:hypothetical protein